MWSKNKSVVLSIVVCFVFAAVLTAGVLVGPWAVKQWFQLYRGWEGEDLRHMVVLFNACFYPSAVFAYVTLYSLLRLLVNIRQEQVFVKANVRYLQRISWCCFAVALITAIGGVQYLPFWFIAIAAAFVGLMLRVVKNVMENAVEIKAENELTI